ncbi:MAG TPA: T9SS type A sorting domain-containing protein [Rubricoccaceae bacterium]|nr:T9SS type A sorting domain-containing protein [Rubricoccaceae bacterium]
MPRSLLVLALLCVLVAAPGRAQWTQLNGPLPPNVQGLGAGDGYLVLGTGMSDAGDVYRSVDGGQTWTNALLPNGGVFFTLAQGDTVFVGTYLSGLHRSTNGGQTWTELPVSGNSFSVMAAVGNALILGEGELGSAPLRRSTDGGDTWTVVGPTADYRDLLVQGQTVLAASYQNGIFRSTDGGQTWSPSNTGLPAGARLGALAAHQGAVFVGLRAPSAPALRVYRSGDGGASWAQVSVDLPDPAPYEIWGLASWRGALYAGLGWFTGGAVYRSTNGGVNWTLHAEGLPAGAASQAFLGTDVALWVGTTKGPYRKMTPDAPWTYAGHGTAEITGVASLLVDGETLFVGLTNNGGGGLGLWRTADRGETWTLLTNGLSDRAAIQALLRHGSTLFAGDYGTFPRGIYRSEDGGTTWTFSSSGIPTASIIHDIEAHDGALYVGAWEGLYRSTDDGFTWTTVPALSGVMTLTLWEGALYAGLNNGQVHRSTDGLTWVLASDGLSTGGRGIEELVVSRGTLYAATWGAGVFRFDGSVWTPAGLSGEYVGALFDVDGVLVGSSALDGTFYSVNGGDTWVPFEDGYAGGEVYELVADDEVLFIGSRGHGLWQRPLSDLPLPTAGAPEAPSQTVSLAVHPNPAATLATLRLEARTPGPARVEVLDALGRAVWRSSRVLAAGPNQVALDLHRLAPGVYTVRVVGAGATQQARLTVVR